MSKDKFISHVPEIDPVSSDYYIACHYFPGWDVKKDGTSGFSKITDFPERTPLLGYYDETDPEVADWQTKWALEHGINCFVYCWYRSWSSFGNPLSKDSLFLAHQLDALFESRYGNMLDFAIMWECDNAAPANGEDDLVNNLLPFWAENYFSRPNYMKIGNKPVLFIYDYSFHVSKHMGGNDKVRHALDACREKIKDYGFDGIVFQVEYRYGDKKVMQEYKDSGYDAIFSYCWHSKNHHTLRELPTQEEIIENQLDLMKKHIEFDPNMSVLTCSQSWDPYPWYRTNPEHLHEIVRWKLSPENWRILLEKVKELADSLPENSYGRRFIMLDNWNEWGEGHYIAPHLAGGFKYLQAVREVFTNRDNLPDYRLPDQLGLGPYLNASALRKEEDLNIKKTVKDYIISIPDFPEKGIIFRDITGVLQNADGLQSAIDELAEKLKGVEFDAIAGAESRGFIFGAPLAYKMNKPFVLIRKKGKLPRETVSKSYSLEYGTAEIEIHKDAIEKGEKVVLIDDLIATGGTMKAAAELVEELGGKVEKILFLIELAGLNGRETLKGYDVDSVVVYEGK